MEWGRLEGDAKKWHQNLFMLEWTFTLAHMGAHTQRKLKWKSQTQHQILLSKHRFELCVGVCRLIVEERGQVPDNWIQLCQTEYLIPFGRRPVRIERQVVRQLYNSHSPRIISHHLLTPAVTAH